MYLKEFGAKGVASKSLQWAMTKPDAAYTTEAENSAASGYATVPT